MSEEIEWFKRFARVYLMWSHHNMDRIVRDVVKKHSGDLARTEREP